MDWTTRRQVLATTASALAAGLAGCSSGGEDTTTGGDGGGGATTTEAMTETTTAAGTTASGVTTVTVGPGGELSFSPSSVTVDVGATVDWSWDSGGHNVVVDSQPDGASWGGTEGGGSKTYGSGHTHSHTFETAGTYAYYCQPHRSVGMTGEVVVE